MGALMRPPLWAASRAYAAIIALRNGKYDRGDVVQRVSVPVISIGNLTTGGTGKTPMTLHVVERLRALGSRPAVVSRGYAADSAQADELALIEGAVADVPCVADPDRVAGAKRAIGEHHADVIVLDDGFQHRRIGRDLDLVLIDASQSLADAHMLPRGRLREPVASLSRADAVILTRVDQVGADAVARLCEQVKMVAPELPVLKCVHRAAAMRALVGDPQRDAAIDSVPAFLASGIARPSAFERTVRDLGVDARGHLVFADHHRFSAADAQRICADAAAVGAERVVVTEKDAVKLARLDVAWTLPVDVLPVRIDFLDDGCRMLDVLIGRAVGSEAAS